MESLVDNPDPFVGTIPDEQTRQSGDRRTDRRAIGCAGRFRRGLGQPLPPDIRRMGSVQ
jgi:hypothetical protein